MIGDVVLAAPVPQASDLVGRVTVFDDPAKPGTTKTHRIVTLNPDGTMVSKGDANPTADSTPVQFSDVRGIGRLLVSYVGLPLIWVQQGQLGLLALFLLSLVVAGVLVNRDQEDDDEDATDDDPSGPGPGNVVPLPAPTSSGGAGSSQIAASQPIDPGLRRAATSSRGARLRLVLSRAAYISALTAVLLIPATTASFAAIACMRFLSRSMTVCPLPAMAHLSCS